jgi:hypothetical protein
MKKLAYLIFLLNITCYISNAQLKVGSNVKIIQTNTNLQVESTSGQQFVVSKDSAKVGIGTLIPAAKLDVIGKVKITDGTEGSGKVLVSDANGQASWQNASTLQTVSTDSTTASNGLTLSSKDVQLGGTLTKATTITTSATNTIALGGLQSGASTDSILVSNPNTGVVRRISPSALGAATEPWFNAATKTGATANTQNIYQLGKIGIGISSPSFKLHVMDSTSTNLGASNLIASFFAMNSQNNALGVGTNLSGSIIIGVNGNTANGELLNNSRYIATPANGSNIQIIDGVGTTPKAYLTATSIGVGIGTTAPTNKLHVKDTINNNPLRLEGLTSGTATDSILVSNPSTGVVRRISPSVLGAATEPWFNVATNAGATTNTQNIYQMGKVGININNPVEQFEVNGNIHQRNYTYFKKTTGNTHAFIWTNFTAIGDAINYSFNYHNADGTKTIPNSGYNTNTMEQRSEGIYFNTSKGQNNVEPNNIAMAIRTSGRVGVNTGFPTTQLHVIDSTNNGPLRLEGLQSGAATDSILVSVPSTGVVRRISPSVMGAASEPWFNVATSSGATSNTQNIYQMGNVGIGTNNPLWRIDVQNNSTSTVNIAQFANTNAAATAEAHIGIGAGSTGAWSRIVGYNGRLGFRNYTTGTEYMTMVNQTGNIGIGTTNPLTTLHVNSSLSGTATNNANATVLRLSRPAVTNIKWDNIAQFNLGSYSNAVTSNSRLDLSMTNGDNNTSLTNVMTWLANGNVGIGTTAPICALHVEPSAAASYNLPNRQFIYGPSFGSTAVQNAGAASQSLQIAAYFGNRIQVNGFIESQAGALTLSDARAKNIGSISNNEQDLNVLNRIQITNYKLKDIQLATNEQKKVIAQQLDTVYPQAVITQSIPKLMPTIYDYPKDIVLGANSIQLTMNKLNYPLKNGESLVIRFKDKEYNCKIININNEKISIEAKQDLLSRKDIKDLFVYGTFVNDAKSVDYDALSMLNISATQALSKKIISLEKENKELKNSLDFLIKELQEIKSKIK